MPSTRRASLSLAAMACAVGLGVCGATWAMAGPTDRTVSDLIDPMPPGVSKLSDVGSCLPGQPASGSMCWRTVAVGSSQGETRAALADRLAVVYRTRGYELTSQELGEDRIWFGRAEDCGPSLVISTNAQGVGGAAGGIPMPGASGMEPGLSTPSSPGAGLPLGGRPTTPPPDGLTSSTDPTAADPTGAIPSGTDPSGADPTGANPMGPVIIQLNDAGVATGC